jgi:hypothetical protein
MTEMLTDEFRIKCYLKHKVGGGAVFDHEPCILLRERPPIQTFTGRHRTAYDILVKCPDEEVPFYAVHTVNSGDLVVLTGARQPMIYIHHREYNVEEGIEISPTIHTQFIFSGDPEYDYYENRFKGRRTPRPTIDLALLDYRPKTLEERV